MSMWWWWGSAPAESRWRRARQGGPLGGRGRPPAGRRRVPLLRLRPHQDDGPRRDALAEARRVARPRRAGDRHVRLGAGARADPRRGDRPTGTTRWPWTGSRTPARTVLHGEARLAGPRRSRSTATTYTAARVSCSTPAPTRRPRRSTGSRTRRTGRTATSLRAEEPPAPWWWSAAGRSAPSWRRRSPASASCHGARDGGPRSRPRGAGGQPVVADVFAARASRC